MARTVKSSCILIVIILLPLATLGTQQVAQQIGPESTPVFKATTRLVVVDVGALDHEGKAVVDLKREDFMVLEDGKEQEIRVFNFRQPRSELRASVAPAAVTPPDNVFTNIPRYNDEATLNVLLLDALNTTTPHQAYVREQMIRLLEKMPEGQPLAIYLLSTKLTLMQDFTSDPAMLREIVTKLGLKVSLLLDNATGSPEAELLPPGLADSGMISGSLLQAMMRFEQEHTAFQTDMRIRYTVKAMSALARTLAGYPGRKNLIWVSEVFPIAVDPNMQLTGDVFAGTRNYGPQIAEAAQSLIESQIAIYPVDARGLLPSSVFDASSSGSDKFGRSLALPGRLGEAISSESKELDNVHHMMRDMAERTGGKAFYNRNDLDGAVRSGIEEGSTYYTLAYYPANKDWNGRFRMIKVKVAREGVKLSHRMGYFAVDPKTFVERNPKQQAEVFGEALNLGSQVSTALKFKARVLPPSGTSNDVQVDFFLDPQAISFDLRADGLQHAKVDCAVQAYSAKGKLLKTESSTVNAALRPETYARVIQTTFPCQQHIALSAGSYLLRLGARDVRTGVIGTANAKVVVPGAAPAEY